MATLQAYAGFCNYGGRQGMREPFDLAQGERSWREREERARCALFVPVRSREPDETLLSVRCGEESPSTCSRRTELGREGRTCAMRAPSFLCPFALSSSKRSLAFVPAKSRSTNSGRTMKGGRRCALRTASSTSTHHLHPLFHHPTFTSALSTDCAPRHSRWIDARFLRPTISPDDR